MLIVHLFVVLKWQQIDLKKDPYTSTVLNILSIYKSLNFYPIYLSCVMYRSSNSKSVRSNTHPHMTVMSADTNNPFQLL